MEIREEDLFHACSACAGTGKVDPPSEPGEAVHITGHVFACDKCGGKGTKLTDTGMILRAFVQMVQDGRI